MVGQKSPTIYKQKLGQELSRLRTSAGLDRTAAAHALDCSVSKIRTIESGHVSIRSSELRALLDLYRVEDKAERADIEHLAEMARQRRPRTDWGAAVPERLRRFFDVEETAVAVQAYATWLMPGLAQTERYARAVLATNSALDSADVERLVRARMARQERLRSPEPPAVTFVVDEHALRIPVGGVEVMREQLKHLACLARTGVATVRVMPTSAGAHPGNGFPFVLLIDSDDRRRVYAETLTDGVLVDDGERTARYEVAMREMIAEAMTPDESLSLLDTVTSQL